MAEASIIPGSWVILSLSVLFIYVAEFNIDRPGRTLGLQMKLIECSSFYSLSQQLTGSEQVKVKA